MKVANQGHSSAGPSDVLVGTADRPKQEVTSTGLSGLQWQQYVSEFGHLSQTLQLRRLISTSTHGSDATSGDHPPPAMARSKRECPNSDTREKDLRVSRDSRPGRPRLTESFLKDRLFEASMRHTRKTVANACDFAGVYRLPRDRVRTRTVALSIARGVDRVWYPHARRRLIKGIQSSGRSVPLNRARVSEFGHSDPNRIYRERSAAPLARQFQAQANHVTAAIQGRLILRTLSAERPLNSLTQLHPCSAMCPNSDTIITFLTNPQHLTKSRAPTTVIKKPAAAGFHHSDRIENIFPMCSLSWFSCSSVITPDLNLKVKPLTSLVMLPA